jgi:two-component system phosphate regulon sensor histidine kinase PhoR
MSWSATAIRIIFAVIAASLVGGYYGYALQTVVVLLLCLIVLWIYQMYRVQDWLHDPELPPPDAYGVWGELLARIYLHQRKDREVRKQLEENIKYLRDSFSSMRDGVVMVDAAGSIEWFNFSVEPLLGLKYPDDVGQLLTNLVREPEFSSYFMTGHYQLPLQYRSAGSTERHLRIEITHFGDSERLLFIRDVSESVRLEQIRTDFVANVSHELRTPLTVITGYLEALDGDSSGALEQFHKPFTQMRQQADRMERLLKDLLWLSRIENEEREERRSLVDMGGLLQELLEDHKHGDQSANIRLEKTSDRKILGDYQELYSAVSNLLGNAIKYDPTGGEIILRWFDQGAHCVLEVEDHGIGIDSTHLPRITERFYRVDDSRATGTGGTGLGLAIVKHVVAAHNGEMKISSKVSAGTKFTLIFPEGGSHDPED